MKIHKISSLFLLFAYILLFQFTKPAFAQTYQCVQYAGTCIYQGACPVGYKSTTQCDQITDLTQCSGTHLCIKTCSPGSQYCDGGRLKTCNSTGDGSVPGSTIDCTFTAGSTCVEDTGGARCQSSSTGGTQPSPPPIISQTDTVIDLNALIDSMGSTRFNSSTTLGLIMTIALPFLYTLAGIGLLFYLIAGGFRYLTSQGDPKKLEGAKTSITMAVVGFIIVITAFFLTQVVNYIFKLGVGV